MTSHSLVKFLGCAFFGMVFSLAPLASTPAAESTEFDPSTIIPQEFLGRVLHTRRCLRQRNRRSHRCHRSTQVHDSRHTRGELRGCDRQ